MRNLPLKEEWFYGAVSLQFTEEGIKPWRIPYEKIDLFPPNGVDTKAAICAGVRLRLSTNSSVFKLTFTPLEEDVSLDGIVDGQLHSTLKLLQGETEAVFSGLPNVMKDLQIYLPQNTGMTITSIQIEKAAVFAVVSDQRPRWVTYGSSITQCVAASSPSYTWPAIVARESGFNLTCLGFSGNCHLEPMVARLIRDLPADFISLCVGINVYSTSSLSPRTFKQALIGMIETIRDKHIATPMLIISPIYATNRETTSNQSGYTVQDMREEIRLTVELFQRRGDVHIYYGNGLDWFSEADKEFLSDGLHPNADGYELMGKRFAKEMILNNKIPL